MLDWTQSPTALKLLCRLHKLRGMLRRRDPDAGREAEGRAAFYETLWATRPPPSAPTARPSATPSTRSALAT